MAGDKESERQARRTLDRLSRESGEAPRGPAVPDDDWAEYWGQRIGRALGLLITIGLLVALALFLLGRQAGPG
ncbi:MAG: hypothetical protein INR68_09060 [Methylobacterium mesophilicum]|nr:hypothetical protein [Methylobacterium mesophilicum]